MGDLSIDSKESIGGMTTMQKNTLTACGVREMGHAAENSLRKRLDQYKYIYMLLIPGVIFYAIFAYTPMYGIILAFKEYNVAKGILESPWVGLDNFRYIFKEPEFWNAVRNTLVISLSKILFTFPVPVILAIMINEVAFNKFKRVVQTVYTFPHFLSWIIVAGITANLLGDQGAINNLMVVLGLPKTQLLTNTSTFRGLIYFSSIFRESGYSCIIYLAAIAGINQELYEAATVDGANRFQKIIHITWPGITSTALVLFILAVGNVMNGGFEQIFNMYNPVVYKVADIIDTYIYRSTFEKAAEFGVSTAVGLFKATFNFIFLLSADRISRSVSGQGIF